MRLANDTRGALTTPIHCWRNLSLVHHDPALRTRNSSDGHQIRACFSTDLVRIPPPSRKSSWHHIRLETWSRQIIFAHTDARRIQRVTLQNLTHGDTGLVNRVNVSCNMVFTLGPSAHLLTFGTRTGLGTISRSSGIARFVQGGVVKTFRYVLSTCNRMECSSKLNIANFDRSVTTHWNAICDIVPRLPLPAQHEWSLQLACDIVDDGASTPVDAVSFSVRRSYLRYGHPNSNLPALPLARWIRSAHLQMW